MIKKIMSKFGWYKFDTKTIQFLQLINYAGEKQIDIFIDYVKKTDEQKVYLKEKGEKARVRLVMKRRRYL